MERHKDDPPYDASKVGAAAEAPPAEPAAEAEAPPAEPEAPAEPPAEPPAE